MKSDLARRSKARSGGKQKAESLIAPAARPVAGVASDAPAGDLRNLIQSARSQVAQATNAALTTHYWRIGSRIRQEVAALRDSDQLSPDLVFQDPRLLDSLGLRDTYSEKDLESALLPQMERFLFELRSGFSFVDRQTRITLDGDDTYIDLPLFH